MPRMSVNRPGLRDEELLEQAYGVAIAHAGDEVSRGGVEALSLDDGHVEKLRRPLAHLFPEPGEDSGGLLEFSRRGGVLVDRIEKEAPQVQHCLEDDLAHPNL